MTITFVGHGYVGLVTACVFADLGNMVYVVGHTPEKLKRLSSGDPLIFEPGLAELLKKNLAAKRIVFTNSYSETVPKSDVVFIAVGTPPKENGEADLSTVLSVATEIGKNLGDRYTVVSCKSTVPVGTNRMIAHKIEAVMKKGTEFDIASCPEFLREGSALTDTFEPDRVVIGSEAQKATDTLLRLHKPLPGARVLVSIESAEIIKYAANSILATKISYANLISFICEKAGGNVDEVMEGIGLDKRIGRIFLDPGVGYGGSCFPKDVKALISTGSALGVDMSLLTAVEKINDQAKENIVEKIIMNTSGKKIGIWGLAFKPNTDDIRFAPSTYIIKKLLKEAYEICAYDPEASINSKKIFGAKITFTEDPYAATKDADALVILTEWNEFKQINLARVKKSMKTPLIFDGRNIYNPQEMELLGFSYFSVGR
ncbi:UDP-glucose 6-dehydrogenase [Candidatus Roizmanbacteria bacterium RIFCSPHIGHO2_02_FULL_40_13b]|uniref:UDP-glucose 6-dehydrogenase n=1 Tax=Candidatus Roizmanbacteria bacterium RIFCSPHIGHO2_01_FULL_39_24 TaxID=1802032 RepID=A0A1F7GKR0_9BACT|nr:MAG: UDP-glucose 6-dehydrogenase [Candidatus Roizmanbacteria bacterium RIFCSPHIGHO2_01_FULL_39_24]OGK26296.1 MAG: UDP-glucose 6-dehydrogenase [Candidatus Roizmanbacteria bacterium RIFCSPHIGHO2_02_FULL_40_13b]OGK49359.1 MAG: UDP-glucose 6-dehydrogenase [Candidatus Roizmanbacteria bacterium RIFCSPLOWO2_01_FULL_40_32]